MRCVILAAGKGVRMMPLTESLPKPLIKINGNAFLNYLIREIIEARFDETGIVVGYKGEMIKRWCEENNFDVKIIEQKEQRGTADAIRILRDFVKDETFVVVMGDNLYSRMDLKKLIVNDKFTKILGYRLNSKKFGEMVLDGEFLKEIREKPEVLTTGIINAGAYKFTKEIFGAINKIELSKRGEYEITDAITLLSKKKKVKVIEIKDFWINFGCLEDIKKAEEFVKSNSVKLKKTGE